MDVGQMCMFFAGLILLIPHRIGMSRVNYVIKRYNLPISRAGLLLYKYHNNIELSLTIGTLLGNIIVWACGDFFGVKQNAWPMWSVSAFMIAFLFLMLISSIYMFKLYISGGDFGHLNAFYFSLIFLTLFDGFANAFAFGINGKFSSMLSAGIPLSGFLVTLLHYIYKFISDYFNLDDFDYYVLRLQLIFNILTLLIALILWTVDLGVNQLTGTAHNVASLLELFNAASSDNDHALDWSPIGLLAISLGTVYAFYPSIAPYSIIDFQYASIIELWILIISALLPLSFAILDLISSIDYNFKFGPSGKIFLAWENATSITSGSGGTSSCNKTATKMKGAITHNWIMGYTLPPKTPAGASHTFSKDNTWKGWLWHCFWFCVIPYILCIQIFMSLLHYPDCILSCFFNKPYRIGFISVLFNTLRELLQALGFAGAGKQTTDSSPPNLSKISCSASVGAAGTTAHSAACNQWKWSTDPTANNYQKTQVNGTIASLNKLITLFVMMFCVFTGDGYLQHYRRCCRDNWPTTGYNKYQSFFYWLRYGFKGGIKSITSSFTDLYYHNLRPQFISYA